jgi:hypothetical protein
MNRAQEIIGMSEKLICEKVSVKPEIIDLVKKFGGTMSPDGLELHLSGPDSSIFASWSSGGVIRISDERNKLCLHSTSSDWSLDEVKNLPTIAKMCIDFLTQAKSIQSDLVK